MARIFSIIHFGPGNVGKEVIKIFFDRKKSFEKKYNIKLHYRSVIDQDSWISAPSFLTENSINNFIQRKKTNSYSSRDILSFINHVPSNLLLIDTTASDKMLPYYQAILKKGGYVVMSNKKNITGSFADYQSLMKYNQKKNHVFYETTVGAGLPIISTLQELLDSGDEIIEIQGCFSGTLGYIFSQLEAGSSFSEAVFSAKSQGYTEPDPRDDLSGYDVGRKALILSRLLGYPYEMESVEIEQLFPLSMKGLNVDQFMKHLHTLDKKFSKLMISARKSNSTFRYTAHITKGICKVGLTKVPLSSDVGSLSGPDNIIVIKTKRYDDHPIIIKGPGAGIEVTAAGVISDIIKILNSI